MGKKIEARDVLPAIWKAIAKAKATEKDAMNTSEREIVGILLKSGRICSPQTAKSMFYRLEAERYIFSEEFHYIPRFFLDVPKIRETLFGEDVNTHKHTHTNTATGEASE